MSCSIIRANKMKRRKCLVNDKQVRTSAQKKKTLLSSIPNKRERNYVIVALVLSLVVVIFGLYLITQKIVNDHVYSDIMEEFGSIARIGFFCALAIYPVFFVLKWKPIKNVTLGKTKLITLLRPIGKFVKQWHVPVAVLSAALVSLHVYMAITNQFEWNFTTISGICSGLLLIALMFMGTKRYKRLDKQWHFRLAIAFCFAFIIHYTFA